MNIFFLIDIRLFNFFISLVSFDNFWFSRNLPIHLNLSVYWYKTLSF